LSINGIGAATIPAKIPKNKLNLNPFLCSYPPIYALMGPLEAAPDVGPVIEIIAKLI